MWLKNRVTQALVFGSIYQGAIVVPFVEPRLFEPYAKNLVAVDPPAKKNNFLGVSRNPLDFPKSQSLRIQPNSSQENKIEGDPQLTSGRLEGSEACGRDQLPLLQRVQLRLPVFRRGMPVAGARRQLSKKRNRVVGPKQIRL